MSVCLFSIEIQTAGQIAMKFGTDVFLEGRKVLGGGHPNTPGYRVCKGGQGCLWSLNCEFWQKLYKTKVAKPPRFNGGG